MSHSNTRIQNLVTSLKDEHTQKYSVILQLDEWDSSLRPRPTTT